MFLIIIFLDPWVWHLNISSVLQLWMTPQNHHQWKIFLIFSKLEFCFYIWLIIIIFTFGDLVGRFSPQIIIINLFKKKYFFIGYLSCQFYQVLYLLIFFFCYTGIRKILNVINGFIYILWTIFFGKGGFLFLSSCRSSAKFRIFYLSIHRINKPNFFGLKVV